MKARTGTLLLLLAVVGSLAHPRVREEIVWMSTAWGDEASDYQGYLSSYPAGNHIAEARARHDERSWGMAEESNTIRAFSLYLEGHPQGTHAAKAQERIEDLRWETARDTDGVTAYEEYVEVYPRGRHVAEAHRRLEELRWKEARASATISAVKEHLGRYPDGRFTDEARAQIASLRVDDLPYTTALDKGTEEALKRFLSGYPGHRRAGAATSALKDIEGRDIVDLVRQGKIKVETQGSGIDDLKLKLRLLIEHPVTVRVPVGTFFAALNGHTQSMVATAPRTITLRDSETVEVEIDVSCANRPRGIPDASDTFEIHRSPSHRELQKLMPVLGRAHADMAVRQAAVWIVTDNADYGDLGILVRRSIFQLSGGTRVIQESEATEAMRICSEAGIDIRNKAIWRDRDRILKGLGDIRLKKWLENL